MKEISLSLEYQQAKRNYKASKSSSIVATNKENEEVNIVGIRKQSSRKSKSNRSFEKAASTDKPAIPSLSSSVSNVAPAGGVARTKPRRSSAKSKSKSIGALPPPTTELGLELLGLVRPSDSRSEFGLSSAIQTHLIESIKLCGLKSRRETSLIDMVHTLCRHLSNREKEIATWTEFADSALISAAGKIHDSLERFHQACASRDNARESVKTYQTALQKIRTQYASITEDHNTLKRDVAETLSTIPQLIADMQSQLQEKLASHIDYLHSESKTEVCDAIEELQRLHDNETQQLETKIHSLTQTVHAGEEKMRVLQNQIDGFLNDLDAEKTKYSELQNELGGAQDRIRHLEQCLEKEKLDKKQQLSEMDDRMHKELDALSVEVEEKFHALTDRKDAEISAALQRAQVAEKVLEELQASLGQMMPSSDQT